MEIIEFRGISVKDGKQVFGYPFGDITPTRNIMYILEGGFVPVKSMPSERFIEVHAHSISQFIGVLDIKEHKVFSNDLVSVKLPDLPYGKGQTIFGKIEYDSYGARFVISEYNYKSKEFDWDTHMIHEDLKIEVINEIP